MTRDNKGTRFNPLALNDLSKDQAFRLHMSIELTMGVLSDLGWESCRLYKTLDQIRIKLSKILKGDK